MSDETWFKVNVRRAIKEKLMNATTRQEKKTLQDLYKTLAFTMPCKTWVGVVTRLYVMNVKHGLEW
jgi:hypothetical protein